ncbi:MAG: hypothetical protein ABL929_11285 [Ferruginibacter sp.]|nr:hypothetical protein [Ferruginibacter sp.]
MKKIISSSLVLFASVAIFISCKHETAFSIANPGGNAGGTTPIPGTTGITCSTDSVYFANSILPLIISGCATTGCHSAASHADGVTLVNYATIRNYVSAGNAGNSKLYKVLVKTGSERMPLPPLPAFTASQIALVQKWINQGAKNNGCDACDTTSFKYATAIQPLMQNNCTGCHNPASLGGGIDLSTYTTVKASVTSGRLWGTINWTAGFSAMPKGGNKMPACQITQIKKWIDAGALNN